MASFKIAQNATFKAEVEIPRVGFDSVKVEIEFKYRDRKELSKYFDKWNTARDEMTKKLVEDRAKWEDATAAQIELEVGQIKEIVVSWTFDEVFTDESLLDLVSSCTGAPAAILDAYQKAYEIARRGN